MSFAFDIMTKKGNTHEVEFLIPEFSKPIEKFQFPMQYVVWKANNIESAATSHSIRYEIQKILPNNSERINFRYGVGINPYYVKIEYTPSTPNAYYTSLKYYGFALNVTPGLNYKLSRFFSIDLNAPLRIYNFQRENNRQDNPILPLRQQRRNYLNHLFFEPAYTIRLGLRYTPNK